MSESVRTQESFTEQLITLAKNNRLVVALIAFLMFSPTILGGILSLAFGDRFVYFAPIFDLWFWRPKLHWLFWMFYSTPSLWVYPIPIGIASYSVYRRGKMRDKDESATNLDILLILFIIFTTITMFYSGVASSWFANEKLAERHAPGIKSGSGEIPTMNVDDPRFATLDYSRTLAKGQFRSNKYTLGSNADIAWVSLNDSDEEKAHWVFPREPATIPKTYFGHQRGAIYVPMDTREGEGGTSTVVTDELKYGSGVKYTDNYKWQIYHNTPFTQKIKDSFDVTIEGETYKVVERVGRTYHVKLSTSFFGLPLPLPVVYTTPVYTGVDVIHSDGEIERVKPGEISSHRVTKNQNTIPYDYSRKVVMALKWYKNGYVDLKIDKNNNYQLADIPGEHNRQPFVVEGEDGDKLYLFAMEPFGKDANGIYKIFTLNGQTGEITRYNLSERGQLTGPSKAANYVEQLRPQWFTTGKYKMSEPIPVSRNNKEYWLFRVTERSGKGGITGYAFVSTVDPENNAYMYENADDAISFMKGVPLDEIGSETKNTTQPTSQVEEGKVVRVMKDTDGDGIPDTVVKRITLSENESLVVSSASNSSK